MTLEEARKEYGELYDFSKDNPNDKIWWTSPINQIGVHLISLDKKHVYNIFCDVPEKLSEEELSILRKVADKELYGFPCRLF